MKAKQLKYRKAARKEAFELVPPTCPVVDHALDTILDFVDDEVEGADSVIALADVLIKRRTKALRRALVNAIQQRLELEDEIRKIRALLPKEKKEEAQEN